MNRSEAVMIRLTPEERETLEGLVEAERAKLEEEGTGASPASVSMTSMVVALVRREARARGLGETKRGRRK